MIKDGDHIDCAVCGTKLDYHCIDAGHLGDTDVATCEECGAFYAEGWIQPYNIWTDFDVPKAQLGYLKQAVKTAEAVEFIKGQLGLI